MLNLEDAQIFELFGSYNKNIEQGYFQRIYSAIVFWDNISKDLPRDYMFSPIAKFIRKRHSENIVDRIIRNNRVPRGTVLHIAPSNIPVLGIYSWYVSSIVGNINIVRLNKANDDIKLFLDIANKYSDLVNDVVIDYGHDDIINQKLTYIVDARMLWGSDKTMYYFSKFSSPKVKDIVFSDKISVSIINLDMYNKMDDNKKERFIELFYRDVFTYNQEGCSSPKLIYFIGSKDCESFFHCLNNYISYGISHRTVYDKYYRKCVDVVDGNSILYDSTNITAILSDKDNDYGYGGYFYCRFYDHCKEIKFPIKCQTVTYFGIARNDILEWFDYVHRFVPVGQAMEFNEIWDGYDLPFELTKTVYFNEREFNADDL